MPAPPWWRDHALLFLSGRGVGAGGEVDGLTDLSRCVQFIVECHGNTLLPQFLGMYRLTVDGDETYMIVTRNVFSHRLSVYKKYDLKVGGA